MDADRAVGRQAPSSDVARGDLDRLAERLDDVFRQMSGTRLLITGGAGFLGYYLVQAPLAWNRANPTSDPVQVTVHDNFLRGAPGWLLDLDDPNLRWLRRDVLEELPSSEGLFDHIIHAASVASPTFYRRHPIETMDANVQGLRILLDHAAGRVGTDRLVRSVLFFSTSEIYGDPDPGSIPTPESYRGNVSCTGPRACYDESKRYGETLCVNFAAQRGVAVTIVRPFNNYGPGMLIDDRRLVPDLVRDVLEGRDMVLLSDGSMTRTFCYVADAVDGYYRALLHGRPGEPYNIGTDSPEISVTGLAERLSSVAADILGYRGQVVGRASDDPDYLVDNPNRRCPIIDKARTELRYEPEVGLDEGLARTLRWFRWQEGAR
jgi:UDP-glucuronate decarboxylase